STAALAVAILGTTPSSTRRSAAASISSTRRTACLRLPSSNRSSSGSPMTNAISRFSRSACPAAPAPLRLSMAAAASPFMNTERGRRRVHAQDDVADGNGRLGILRADDARYVVAHGRVVPVDLDSGGNEVGRETRSRLAQAEQRDRSQRHAASLSGGGKGNNR